MVAIADIAARDGVSKQAVSKKVAQLVDDHGLTVERDGRGRVAKVNLAQYDHLRGRVDDPSKVQAPPPDAPAAPKSSESYDEALRQRTWMQAERERLRLEEERRQLLRAVEVVAAAEACAEEVKLIIRRLANAADDIGAAFERDGGHGLRVALKQIADRQCSEIADAFERLAAAAKPTTAATTTMQDQPLPLTQ